MTATIHHRTLGVFPADKPPLTLQAHRACQEFFDKVDIDRLRKLAKNFLPSEWKKDFDHRNNALLEIYEKGLLGDALRFKARLEKQRLAYYAYRIKRAAYLSATEVEKPEHLPFAVFIERQGFRAALCGGIALFATGMLQPSLDNSGTAHATQAVETMEEAVSAATAQAVASKKTSSLRTGPSDVKSREELGTYTEPEYPYPHLRIETGPAGSVKADFIAFWGKDVGKGLYSRYIGVEGEIPRTSDADPLALQARMFELKYANNKDATPAARKMQHQYAEMYSIQRTHMTLRQFVHGVGMVIDESIASIDWNGLCADPRLRLNTDQCALLQTLSKQITAEEQVAYAITELLANDKKTGGVFNAYVIDMGLRNFGREFFDLIPAQGDGLASGGLWQFTCYAVGAYNRTDGKGNMVPETAPVTIVSRHAGIKVPESFLNFKRTDHERASVYFRVSNLAFLVKDATKDKKAYETLKRVAGGGFGLDMLTFTATSHHAQNKVRGYAIKWLRGGAKKPFADYLRGRFVEYGKKTRINYPGLITYLNNPAVYPEPAGVK